MKRILYWAGRIAVCCLLFCCVVPISLAQATERPPWETSRVKGTPDPPLPLTIERVMEDVEMTHPTEMVRVPGTDRWIVCEWGRIHSFSKQKNRDSQVSLNMKEAVPSSSQIFGITFHPEFPKQPWVYVTYTAENNTPTGTRLSRFLVTDPTVPIIDPSSEVVFARWISGGHSGGCLQFGPEGYLYVSIGDGQNPNPPDQLETGQDLRDLEASVLRIDVDHASDGLPYRIPRDNPFVGQAGVRGEIFAFGFRNPWKMAFDPKSRTLWTGDVGWEMMEMVYRVDRGGNYGWSIMEGSQVVKQNGQRSEVPITPPIVEHTHLEARSITGGHFWYADRLPELKGSYLYGDWMTGKIWALRHDGQKVTWHKEIADTTLQIICFALDDDGEVFVVGYDGSVHRLVPNPRKSASAEFPRKLSETGLFASTEDQVPAAGVVPYEINSHHWADHTESQQWIGIPGRERLSVFEKDDWQTGQVKGHFIFPHDTVVAKTVFYQTDAGDPASTRRLETQLLHRNGDDWNAYNYIWNDQQTDAILQDNVASNQELEVIDVSAAGGVRKQTWHHASRDECLLCHIWSAGTVHGFKANQLDQSLLNDSGNQLDLLEAMGIFESSVASVEPAVSPLDESKPLEARARSYLHMNCAHCHRRGGGGTAAFELVGDLPLKRLDLVDALPTQGTFGLSDARVVAPGDPSRSVLLYRLVKSGRGHMPQFGPSLIDDRGVQLVHHWIASLGDGDAEGQIDSLVTQLSQWKTPLSSDRSAAVQAMLRRTEDALVLAIALCDPTVSHATRSAIADLAAVNPEGTVRDLFERFLPEHRRVKRLGTTVDTADLLAIKGDVKAGRNQFEESAVVNCRQCHRIGNVGVAVGPSLDSIGIQRTPAEILQSILDPSAKIDAKYQGKTVLTVDGVIVSGLVIKDDRQSMTLLEPSGKQRVIALSEIESIKPMQKSVMPDLLFAEFTAQQAADLLAFLIDQDAPIESVRE